VTSIGSPLLFVRVGSLIVRAIESKPLASINDAYFYLGRASAEHQYTQKRLSPCAVSGVAL
jgi:hypothetical protein